MDIRSPTHEIPLTPSLLTEAAEDGGSAVDIWFELSGVLSTMSSLYSIMSKQTVYGWLGLLVWFSGLLNKRASSKVNTSTISAWM